MVRPWIADDGALIRIRVPGGQVRTEALADLVAIAERHGDGRLHLTGRANLQLRALRRDGDALPAAIVAEVEATGLLPSRTHDRIRNILVSPQTGLAGGLADLRPVTAALDNALLADARFAALPGRFLFTLDDGRGDLHDRHLDLGLVAVDDERVRLRIDGVDGPTVAFADAVPELIALTDRFLNARGTGPDAPWHVRELTEPLVSEHVSERPAAPVSSAVAAPLPYGRVPGGTHVDARDGVDAATVRHWAATTDRVVLTPWHGILIPEQP